MADLAWTPPTGPQRPRFMASLLQTLVVALVLAVVLLAASLARSAPALAAVDVAKQVLIGADY
ncbi:MAG: hypothetical protein EA413_05195, partial [Cyanobium sp. PLM2.Bin73]